MIQKMDFITFNTSTSPINITKSLLNDTLSIIVSGIINTFGFIINCMVMVHSIRNWRAPSNTSHFVRNLLLANIVSSLAWVIATISMIVFKQAGWPFILMHYTCKFGTLFWLMCYTASVGTLTLLSIERHRAILYPTRPRLNGFKLIIILVILWVLSIVISIPIYFITSVDRVTKFDCNIRIESSQTFHVFHIIFLDVVDYLLPICIMIFCYTRVVMKFRQTSAIALRNKKDLSAGEHRKKQVTKKLICLTICFILTALPWIFTFNLIFIQNNQSASPQNNNPFLENFIHFIPVVFLLSLFYDPIFYILNNRNDGNRVVNYNRSATSPFRKIRINKLSCVTAP